MTEILALQPYAGLVFAIVCLIGVANPRAGFLALGVWAACFARVLPL